MVLIYNFFSNKLKVATIYKYQYSPISIKKSNTMAKRTTRRVSQETRQKMSAAHRGSKNSMWKHKHTATTKRRISEALKRYWQHLPKT